MSGAIQAETLGGCLAAGVPERSRDCSSGRKWQAAEAGRQRRAIQEEMYFWQSSAPRGGGVVGRRGFLGEWQVRDAMGATRA